MMQAMMPGWSPNSGMQQTLGDQPLCPRGFLLFPCRHRQDQKPVPVPVPSVRIQRLLPVPFCPHDIALRVRNLSEPDEGVVDQAAVPQRSAQCQALLEEGRRLRVIA